jgi:hypothetical protein
VRPAFLACYSMISGAPPCGTWSAAESHKRLHAKFPATRRTRCSRATISCLKLTSGMRPARLRRAPRPRFLVQFIVEPQKESEPEQLVNVKPSYQLVVLGAGVAELADAQDLAFRVSHPLTPAHCCSCRYKVYLERKTKKTCYCSPLIILAHPKVIDKQKQKAGRHSVQGRTTSLTYTAKVTRYASSS